MIVFVFPSLTSELKGRIKTTLKNNATVYFNDELSIEEKTSFFLKSDCLLGNVPPAWFHEKAHMQLRFWQLDSVGFDQYKHLTLTTRISNMGDYFSLPCAETIVAGLLMLYRKMNDLLYYQQKRFWIGKKIRPELQLLSKKKIIILGAGKIASHLAALLSGFSNNIKFVSRKNPAASFHEREDVLKALPTVDVVINTLPGTAHHYVDGTFFNAMKNESIYATVGRGNTTDEAALLKSLESGKLAGAIVDVTQEEPLPYDHPFWKNKNIILSQHSGGGHYKEDEWKTEIFLKNFFRFQRNDSLLNEISLSKGY
jgi:glyoxylate/hydroxypyruvate reductase